MPTPKRTDEDCAEAWALYLENGRSVRGAATAAGIPYNTMHTRIADAKLRGFDIDPAVRTGMNALGMKGVPPGGWVKSHTPDENGLTYSFRLPSSEDPLDLAEKIRAAFEDVTPTAPIDAPHQVNADLLTVYPVMDVHLGMYAWGKETGNVDYDIDLATADMRHAFTKVLAITPNAETGVLIVGGDFFHADDNRNETPANRHKLDSDGRFDKVAFAGVRVLVEVLDRLLAKHRTVHVQVLRGNHDENSHRIIKVGLWAWYRDNPRLQIEIGPRDLFMMQWGKCAIFSHHGDKAKPDRAALYLSDVCPFWSETRHRHYLTGHVHHDNAKDVGPLRWESLRAFCPPDAYAASMGFGARRALQSLTFHRQDGLVLRALDPIDRPDPVPHDRRSPMEHERG